MENENLTMNDVMMMLQIVDASAQRGAIRGDEMVTVGNLRSKLEKLIRNSQEQTSGTPSESGAVAGSVSEAGAASE